MQPSLRKRRQISQTTRPERPLVYEKLSDAILVKRAKDGDKRALEALCERHAAKVERLAGHLLSDPEAGFSRDAGEALRGHRRAFALRSATRNLLRTRQRGRPLARTEGQRTTAPRRGMRKAGGSVDFPEAS